MDHVAVVGGGLAGCTAALELAGSGVKVTLIEKTQSIGGKVRGYGCKATDRCANCGLCLAGSLWKNVENHESIEILTCSHLVDVSGKRKNYRVVVRSGGHIRVISQINSIIVAAGFEAFSSISCGSLELYPDGGVITGLKLERILSERTGKSILPEEPSSIAFIHCFGSRDVQEKSLYCSRVCCGYATRAARVFRHYYTNAGITLFYMDLQGIKEGEYYRELSDENIEFIRCRPVTIKGGKPASVLYEGLDGPGVGRREFDLVVLCEGIHPPSDAERLAEICMLGLDENGFLKYVDDCQSTGMYLAGCVSGPKRIEETYLDALLAARKVLEGIQ